MKIILKSLTVIAFWYVLILILVTLVGCKSKAKVVNTVTKDTIYKHEIIKIDKPQLNEIVITDVCDSLGRVKPIYLTNTTSNTKTILKSVKDTLYLTTNTDSIVNSKLEDYKSSLQKEVKIIEKKNPLNYKLLLYSILLTLWTFRKPIIKLIKPI